MGVCDAMGGQDCWKIAVQGTERLVCWMPFLARVLKSSKTMAGIVVEKESKR